MFKHLRDDNRVTGGECGSWCVEHGGVAEAGRKIAEGMLKTPKFEPPKAQVLKKQKQSKKKRSVEGNCAYEEASSFTSTDDNDTTVTSTVTPQPKPFLPERPGKPNELWVGGIPELFCKPKSVAQILYQAIPGNVNVASPAVRHVVRKGWRESTRLIAKSGSEDSSNADYSPAPLNPCSPPDTLPTNALPNNNDATETISETPSPETKKKKEKGAWIGFAFVTFRDKDEANLAMGFIHEKVVTHNGVQVTLRASPATVKGLGRSKGLDKTIGENNTDENGLDASGVEKTEISNRLAPGADPDRITVARAWSKAVLGSRAKGLGFHNVEAYLDAERRSGCDGEGTSATDNKVPSPELVYVSGAPVPNNLLHKMRTVLDTTRWPPTTHRKSVTSEKYLVLVSGQELVTELQADKQKVDPYRDIKLAAHEIIKCFDPDFRYDRLAITKNFQGSPHVDVDDVTWQYGVSLGEFGVGGQLVVESENGETRWVVDTKNKIAKFDGRFAHWVRGFGDGIGDSGDSGDSGDRGVTSGDEGVTSGDISGDTSTRYSVIFYANKPVAATARTFAVDEEFVEKFRRGELCGRKVGSRLKEFNPGTVPGAVDYTRVQFGGMNPIIPKCLGVALALGIVVGGRRGR